MARRRGDAVVLACAAGASGAQATALAAGDLAREDLIEDLTKGDEMDGGLTGQYLDPIAGLEAALWVPPSRGQLLWLRLAPALFAPARGTGRGLARWWAIATVTPGTN